MRSAKVLLVAVGSALILTACGGGTGTAPDTGCTVTPASTATPTLTSKIIPDPNTIGRFVPSNMTVKVGQAIRWDWQDPNVQHSVTSDDGTTFDSCLQNQGHNFTVTFSTAGAISYHCTIHPLMVGTITVTP